MYRLAVFGLLLLLVGCGKKDRAGSGDLVAIMKGQPTTYWIEQLTNTDEEQRNTAVKLLVEYGKKDETVVEDLAEALKTKEDPELRMAICGVLERIGMKANTDEVVGVLKIALRSKEDRVANSAGKALWRLNKEEARAAGVAPPPPPPPDKK